MTKIIMLIIIALAGLIAYNYFTSGEISLIPSSSISEEEHELKCLADDFRKAKKQVKQAERVAAVSGVGSTLEVEDAITEIERIENALITLKDRLKSESTKREAERLESKIKAFKSGTR